MCLCASNTFTDSVIYVEGKASWAFTLEAAKGVDASSSLAQAWQLLAFVDVCQREKGNTEHHCGWVCMRCTNV